MADFAKTALDIAKQIQEDANEVSKPPAEGEKPSTSHVVSLILVKNVRLGYIVRVVNQINGAYQHGWYDASLVMLRRLIETLIIEAFEHHQISSKIKNSSGDYLYLSDLINATLTESSWHLGRNAKNALPKLKSVGDQSAHSRRYNANRDDVEKLLHDIRTVVEELLHIANLR